VPPEPRNLAEGPAAVATAATFPSEKHLSSWVGACPGDEESTEVNHSCRSPQGNRHMRRILNQAANAAVKHKGSIFQILYDLSMCRVWDTIKPSEQLPTNFVAWSGDIATGNPLRRTRPRGHQSVQAKAHPENDPRTPQAWLPNRTEPFSISHHSMIAISDWNDFRPCPLGPAARETS
jgi:hypothetical protein